MTRRLAPFLAAAALVACSAPSPGPGAPAPVRQVGVAAVVATVATPDPRTSARYGGKRWARGLWFRFPPRIEKHAWCVANHESIHAGLWTAESSGGSGFAQWTGPTWATHMKRAGVTGPRRAAQASPRKQARVFAHNWPTSKRAWTGTGCFPGDVAW